jgi:hypothetical protein
MEQRFPELIVGMTDVKQAFLIMKEVQDAIDAGRHGVVPPAELAPPAVERWIIRERGSYVCWTKEKDRGYLVIESEKEGITVLTVLKGYPRTGVLRDRLYGKFKAAS